jgi:hypothetical protein
MRHRQASLLRSCLLVAPLLSLGAAPGRADPPLVLPVQPARVALVGTLKSRVFYASPGSGDDRREQFVVLLLDEPVQVAAPGGAIIDEVGELQVATDRPERLQPLLGARVAVRGTLFVGREGRHHTRVVLYALSAERAQE